MQAKTFNEYWEEYEKKYDAQWWEDERHKETWKAATKATEEKLASPSNKSTPCKHHPSSTESVPFCEQCGGKTEIEHVCLDCGYYPGIED